MDSFGRDLEKFGLSMDNYFDQLIKKMDELVAVRDEIASLKEKNEKNFIEVINRLDQLESKYECSDQHQTTNETNGFSTEMIAKARDSLGLDLTQELVRFT